MSTLLEESTTAAAASSASERLQATTTAMRLSFTWFGTKKTLTAEQKARAAESFDAEESCLSAGKKLLDIKHPLFRAVSSVKSRANAYFRGVSLPFPQPGIRLVRHEQIDEINARMQGFREELDAAVEQLDRHLHALKDAAWRLLGSLYNESDYPASLRGLFTMRWDFPNIEPPDYLQQLNPEVYRQECQRVQQRFNEAVRLAEQAFLSELAKLVSHLSERLSGNEDGRPKIFKDSAVENLTEFFERFRDLNIGSSQQLDQLVTDAQGIVRGVRPQQLRDDQGLRQHVATELSAVQSVLDGLLVDRPRRNILRRPR